MSAAYVFRQARMGRRLVAGSVCVQVEGEVVKTASDPAWSAPYEQPVVCEGSEKFPGVDHGDATQVAFHRGNECLTAEQDSQYRYSFGA